jgi:RNA polymerase sigma factor (sigma-70 family)
MAPSKIIFWDAGRLLITLQMKGFCRAPEQESNPQMATAGRTDRETHQSLREEVRMRGDEIALWRRFREGDKKALEELREFYKNWLGYLVNKVCSTVTKADRDDLMQEGRIKLEELIHSFDPDEGDDFISFARWRIGDALYDSLKQGRVTPYQYKRFRKIIKAQDELRRSSGTDPTVDEIARKIDLSPKQVERAIDAMSIGFPNEFIDSDLDLPASVIMSESPDNVILIGELLLKLNERERFIITEYYFWGRTDLEISQQLGLTKDNTKRIRLGALKKLGKLLSGEPGGEQHEEL